MQNLTFNELANLFLNDYLHQVKPSSFKKIKGLFYNHFIPHFNERLINSITTSEIQQYIYYLNTIFVRYKKQYYYLKKCFNFAEKRNYIIANPCNDVVLPQSLKMPPKRKLFLDLNELQTFLSACLYDSRFFIYPFFRLLAISGLRRQEILALTWNNINFNEHYIDINKAISYDLDGTEVISNTKNITSSRIITIDTKTLDFLCEWKSIQAEEFQARGIKLLALHKQYVFTKKAINTHVSLSTPFKWIEQVCRCSNLPHFSPHILRHTHCSLLIENQGNIKEIQQRMGHADINTTLNYYTHVLKKNLIWVIN